MIVGKIQAIFPLKTKYVEIMLVQYKKHNKSNPNSFFIPSFKSKICFNLQHKLSIYKFKHEVFVAGNIF